MYITKYNPSLVNVFDNLFENYLSESQVSKVNKFLPHVDIVEAEKEFEIHAAIPGINKEDFKIEIDKKILTLSGERKFVNEESSKNFKSIETNYGKFSRSFTLPENIDSEKIEASYENGILKISIPKSEIIETKKVVSIK
ncbi:MAG: Hsp20/alpha crystallin family protein [Bacteroidetes bacterium]|nr:MAG: Hsp20/alpha crystallin family protein [Bacteroidota bacterium]